ncbi:conserved Plasmodium protein, unknown function [Plasmodium gallinaceum]|uniref:Fam-b protein n=1 Tax=Plasmodium gallinaceum TaxID=5849 RepID=A0A1J1GYW7_PLAGA|nr:conserved Plasmodium protein, unknown function [Plasmodium gallinaceum]CRG97770.1 conserved Plasmodium protein, unknown function [Plasmodium gallinaceum]
MIIKFILFILFIKTYNSFQFNYKILPKSDYKHNCVKKFPSVNYFYKFQNVKSKEFKNKILSFFSNYFNRESDKYTLNQDEKDYLNKLGVSENDDYKDLVKSHEEYIKTISDIKSKLKYKDLFFFITQKLIHKNLYEFKRKQKYNIFQNDEYTSELSIDYVKNSNIEEKFKEILLKKLSRENNSHKFRLLRIFKWKSASDIFNISKLIIPIASIGLFLSKMAIFSVVVNMIITAHFLTFKKDQKKKMKISTLILTMVLILVHSSFGIVCNSIFFHYFKFNIPTYIKRENILSIFVNIQLYIASLIYFTNNNNHENEDVNEDVNDSIFNNIDFDDEFSLEKNK